MKLIVAVLPILVDEHIVKLPISFNFKTIKSWQYESGVVFPAIFSTYIHYDIMLKFISEVVDEESIYQQFGYKEFEAELYFINEHDAIIYKLVN